MSPKIIALLLVTLSDFILAVVFYFQSRRSLVNVSYALFALSVTLWGLSLAFFLWLGDSFLLDSLARLVYFSGGSIAPAFYYFTRLFQSQEKRSSLEKIIFLPTGILFVLFFFSDLIISGYTVNSSGVRGFLYGPMWLLFDLHLWTFFVLALLELIKKYRSFKDDGLRRAQIMYVALGTYIVLPIAAITNIISPYFGKFGYIWLGPTMTIVWVILVTYAIAKHNLLNIRVIATELFTALILLTLLAEIFFVNSITEFVIKATVLALVTIFGILIIKSALNEVATRERIEFLAADLQKANLELERVNQAKSDFLSIASHQLKTPLSIIKGYISMAMEGSFGKVSKTLNENLEKVYLSNERLISLVEDLLNLSRIEDGRMKYELTTENLADVAGSVYDELHEQAEHQKLRLIWEPPKEEILVNIDKNKVRNVIFNLVDNAIKYTQRGSITMELSKQKGNAVLRVSDTGIGIAPEHVGRLFSKFTRLGTGPQSYAVGGFGLGLYVAKLIIQDHKGKIFAESAGLGKGSTFIMEIPLSKKSDKHLKPVKLTKTLILEKKVS